MEQIETNGLIPDPMRHCKVIVIGAGASGLSCANKVMSFFENEEIGNDVERQCSGSKQNVEPVIVLEARDRIGGRIHSVTKKAKRLSIVDTAYCSLTQSKSDDLFSEFIMEEGAAWVHGTGVPVTTEANSTENNETSQKCQSEEMNPMVNLLQKIAEKRGLGNFEKMLDYVSPLGNPWTRPRTVLHSKLDFDVSIYSDNHIKEQKIPKTSQHVAIFMNGKRLDPSSKTIVEALKSYERIMISVAKVANASISQEVDASKISVAEAISSIRRDANFRLKLGDSVEIGGDEVDSLIQFYSYVLECWYSSPLTEVQLSEFVGDGKIEERPTGDEGDFPGPHCIVPSGMRCILDPLLNDGIENRILCNQEVVKVSRKFNQNGKIKESVVVSTSSGLVVEADVCVVTIPLGCLKDAIKSRNENNGLFHPNVSVEKIQAINALSMGCYKKVFLTFSEIFWPVHEPFIGIIRTEVETTDSSAWLGDCLFIDNIWTRNGIPSFEVTLVGKAGKCSVSKSDKFIRENVIKFLQQAFFENSSTFSVSDSCTDCHITRWEEDRFSKGAYSGYILGTQPHHTEALNQSEWNGMLIFAGEATSDEYEGSVHGALLSGIEASDKVVSILEKNNRE